MTIPSQIASEEPTDGGLSVGYGPYLSYSEIDALFDDTGLIEKTSALIGHRLAQVSDAELPLLYQSIQEAYRKLRRDPVFALYVNSSLKQQASHNEIFSLCPTAVRHDVHNLLTGLCHILQDGLLPHSCKSQLPELTRNDAVRKIINHIAATVESRISAIFQSVTSDVSRMPIGLYDALAEAHDPAYAVGRGYHLMGKSYPNFSSIVDAVQLMNAQERWQAAYELQLRLPHFLVMRDWLPPASQTKPSFSPPTSQLHVISDTIGPPTETNNSATQMQAA